MFCFCTVCIWLCFLWYLFYYFCFQKYQIIKVNYLHFNKNVYLFLMARFALCYFISANIPQFPLCVPTCSALFLWLSKQCAESFKASRSILLSRGADTIKNIKSKCKTIQKERIKQQLNYLWLQMNPLYCGCNHFIITGTLYKKRSVFILGLQKYFLKLRKRDRKKKSNFLQRSAIEERPKYKQLNVEWRLDCDQWFKTSSRFSLEISRMHKQS